MIESSHERVALEELRRAALNIDHPVARSFAVRAADSFIGSPDQLVELAADVASNR
ncbi:hypothetical protein [Nocardioides halotolerans]|uniref:hypothetical protein n=1 Tax=Nocardioides halotolerans TaxID=433660 RepID=UPI00041DF223|nr:hypothetical protein [Nocardioides halotolerans]